jgi:hypothetical protein
MLSGTSHALTLARSIYSRFRFGEIGMCATMSYVTFCLGKSRQRASERNRRKKSHLNDVKLGRSDTIDIDSCSDG